MALKAREDFTPDWFTPKSQVDTEDPARFKIKPLNSEQLDFALDGATYGSEGELIDLSPRGKTAALKHGLVEWENFDVRFSPANFNQLPWKERQEIALQIIMASVLSGEQVKN